MRRNTREMKTNTLGKKQSPQSMNIGPEYENGVSERCQQFIYSSQITKICSPSRHPLFTENIS